MRPLQRGDGCFVLVQLAVQQLGHAAPHAGAQQAGAVLAQLVDGAQLCEGLQRAAQGGLRHLARWDGPVGLGARVRPGQARDRDHFIDGRQRELDDAARREQPHRALPGIGAQRQRRAGVRVHHLAHQVRHRQAGHHRLEASRPPHARRQPVGDVAVVLVDLRQHPLAVGRCGEALPPQRRAGIAEAGAIGRVVADQVDVEEVVPGGVHHHAADAGAVAVIGADGPAPARIRRLVVTGVDAVHHFGVGPAGRPAPGHHLRRDTLAVGAGRVFIERHAAQRHLRIELVRHPHLALVHVVRKLGDRAGAAAQQRVRIRLAVPGVTRPFVPLQAQLLRDVVGLVLEHHHVVRIGLRGVDPRGAQRRRRAAPGAHGAHPRQLPGQGGAQPGMVTRGEHAAALVHEPGDRGALVIRQHAGVIAQQPDLVVGAQVMGAEVEMLQHPRRPQRIRAAMRLGDPADLLQHAHQMAHAEVVFVQIARIVLRPAGHDGVRDHQDVQHQPAADQVRQPHTPLGIEHLLPDRHRRLQGCRHHGPTGRRSRAGARGVSSRGRGGYIPREEQCDLKLGVE